MRNFDPLSTRIERPHSASRSCLRSACETTARGQAVTCSRRRGQRFCPPAAISASRPAAGSAWPPARVLEARGLTHGGCLAKQGSGATAPDTSGASDAGARSSPRLLPALVSSGNPLSGDH